MKVHYYIFAIMFFFFSITPINFDEDEPEIETVHSTESQLIPTELTPPPESMRDKMRLAWLTLKFLYKVRWHKIGE